jgi:hypothetical protein
MILVYCNMCHWKKAYVLFCYITVAKNILKISIKTQTLLSNSPVRYFLQSNLYLNHFFPLKIQHVSFENTFYSFSLYDPVNDFIFES